MPGEEPREPTEFGRVVRELRNYLDISMDYMAKEFDVSKSRLSQLELGMRTISADMCQRYINFFKEHGYDIEEYLWEARAESLPSDKYCIEGLNDMSSQKRELVLFFGDRLEHVTDRDAKVILRQLKDRVKKADKESSE